MSNTISRPWPVACCATLCQQVSFGNANHTCRNRAGGCVLGEGGRGAQGLVRAGLAGDAGAAAHGLRGPPDSAICAAGFPAEDQLLS